MNNIKCVLILTSLLVIISVFVGSVSAANDTSAPRVSAVDPVNNSCNVSYNKILRITFNEPIKEGSKYIELKSSNNTVISINKSVGNKVLTITPNTLLNNGTKYTLYLHTGSYTDLAGNPLKLYSTCFTVNNITPLLPLVYLQKIQTDRTINGKQYYTQYAIYQKPTNSTNWNRYLFYHIVNAAKLGVNGPEDEYRIYKLQNVVLGNNSKYFPDILSSEDLTVPGNWEKAITLSGSLTKVGGMHGYESYTGITFYENGTRIIPNINTPITSCKDLQIVETSNLLNPNNLTQIIAKTTTTYDWNGEDLLLHTIYKWKINTTVTEAYVAMFPTKNNATITSMGQIDGLNVENFQTRTTYLRGNSAMGTVWNNINNLYMSMEVLNPLIALNNYLNNGNSTKGETWFRTQGYYIKLYISRVNAPGFEEINDTSIWDIQTRYKIWNKKLL